jgi:hypothetical protein
LEGRCPLRDDTFARHTLFWKCWGSWNLLPLKILCSVGKIYIK